MRRRNFKFLTFKCHLNFLIFNMYKILHKFQSFKKNQIKSLFGPREHKLVGSDIVYNMQD
jgi:hypothetical protein